MRRVFFTMVGRIALFSLVCILHCTGGGLADAGFIASWRIHDDLDVELTCEMLSADHVSIEVVDSSGVSHVYRGPCADMGMETKDWDIAVGKGTISASVRTAGDIAIASTKPIAFKFVSGKLSNRLPEVLFIIPESVLADMGPDIEISTVLQDTTGQTVTCEAVGATFFSFTLTDASGRMFELGDAPCMTETVFHTKMKTIPTPGEAELEIAFRNATFVRVFQTTTTLRLPIGDAQFGPLSLVVTPQTLEGDAGIVWTWTNEGLPLTDETCDELGIDYAKLFVWDEVLQFWWTDPVRLVLPCSAFDHADDDVLFGDDVYSGFYIPNFVSAGDYRLFLGFYRKFVETGDDLNTVGADELVAYDEAYPGNEGGPIGTLKRNDESELGINSRTTELSTIIRESGVINLSLLFELDETGAVGNCGAASIAQVGMALYNGDAPAASLVLSQYRACQDTVSFFQLLRVDKPYTFVAYGLNNDGNMSRYAVCDGLVPEIDIGLPISVHSCILSLLDVD